jgi:hypothetical protein
MSQTEYAKVLQVAVAGWGVLGLALLFAPGKVLGALTRGRVLFSRGTILFFRLAGTASAIGACYMLFFLHA